MKNTFSEGFGSMKRITFFTKLTQVEKIVKNELIKLRDDKYSNNTTVTNFIRGQM